MKTEPAAIIGFITALAAGILTLVASFGGDISEDQRLAILGIIGTLAPLVAAVIIRFNVFSPAKTQALVDTAYRIDPPDTVPLGEGIQTPDVTLKTTPAQLRTQAIQLQR